MAITNTFVRNYPFGDLAAHILGYVGEISEDQLKSSKGYVLGRQGRPGRGRVLVRQGAPRPARPEPAARRLARAADQPDRAAHAHDPRLRGPAHARREAPARRAAGDRQRDQPRSGRPPVVREGGRDRRPRPAGRSDPGARLVPDLRPEGLHEPQERRARAAARPERGPGGRLPGARPRDRRRVSTGLDVQARDRAGRDAGAHPVAVQRAALHGHVQGRRSALQELGPVREHLDDPADRDRPVVRHVLLPGGQGVLRPAARPRPAAPALGEDVRLRAAAGPRRRARDVGSAADDRVEAQDVHEEDRPGNWQIDRLWKPGDSIQLAIGQKDMLASPLQMARFYALLANGGKLVTPHLVSTIEQPGPRNGPSQGGQVLRRYQAPTKELNLDPGAITAIRDGLLRGDALGARHLVEHLRQLSGRDRRQDGHGGDACRRRQRVRARYEHLLVVRLRPVRRPTSRRLRGDRERRLRRRGRGALGPSGVRAVLREEGHQREHGPTD